MKVILHSIAALSLWGVVAAVVTVVDPASVKNIGLAGAYLPFFVPLFFALFYTSYLVFATLISSLVIASLIILALVLSMYSLLNLYLVSVIAALIFFTIYIHTRH